MVSRSSSTKQKGQGLVEYALILVLVALVVIVVLLILGPTIGNVFTKLNSSLASAGGSEGSQTTPQTTPQPTATPNWVFCASENSFCSFSGSATVRYGANGTYTYGTFSNGVNCSNSIFGDPLYGVFKACYYYQ